MGIYLNPGNVFFNISVNGDIYIDKSGLIAFINSKIDKSKRFVCVRDQGDLVNLWQHRYFLLIMTEAVIHTNIEKKVLSEIKKVYGEWIVF